MIPYKSDIFGLRTLFVWKGSAVFRAVLPASFSTALLVLYFFLFGHYIDVDHIRSPYPITVFVAMFSFLLTFRLNYSYQRYWEAATWMYRMKSKWLDSAICLASFHYQSHMYDNKRPKTFGQNATLINQTRLMEQQQQQQNNNSTSSDNKTHSRHNKTMEETEALLNAIYDRHHPIQNNKLLGKLAGFFRFKKKEKQQQQQQQQQETGSAPKSTHDDDPVLTLAEKRHKSEPSLPSHQQHHRHHIKSFRPNDKYKSHDQNYLVHHTTNLHRGSERLRSPLGGGPMVVLDRQTQMRRAHSAQRQRRFEALTAPEQADDDPPSLFLQEAAHLYSLLSAVAMSTLRADVEGTQSPLTEYIPGQPFPPVNSEDLVEHFLEHSNNHDNDDNNHKTLKKTWKQYGWEVLLFFSGLDRTAKQRTLYNASRPFGVIGGVSDDEAAMLQQARGPYAQMALCNMWLKEFYSREYLNGSTGNVSPPILGRVYQFISDGVTAYNQCRKVAFVPFPFAHAQMTVLFALCSAFIFPFLYIAYVPNHLAFACVLNFITNVCFQGIHEVARELTNPYITVPNDLPLNNFQAQFNEALICMYAGFHPDQWKLPPEPFQQGGEEEYPPRQRVAHFWDETTTDTPTNKDLEDQEEEEEDDDDDKGNNNPPGEEDSSADQGCLVT